MIWVGGRDEFNLARTARKSIFNFLIIDIYLSSTVISSNIVFIGNSYFRRAAITSAPKFLTLPPRWRILLDAIGSRRPGIAMIMIHSLILSTERREAFKWQCNIWKEGGSCECYVIHNQTNVNVNNFQQQLLLRRLLRLRDRIQRINWNHIHSFFKFELKSNHIILSFGR